VAENKTQKTDASVDEYLAGIPGSRGADARALKELMAATGLEPAMWGTSIVGFGRRTAICWRSSDRIRRVPDACM
jgi:hypothetical protein